MDKLEKQFNNLFDNTDLDLQINQKHKQELKNKLAREFSQKQSISFWRKAMETKGIRYAAVAIILVAVMFGWAAINNPKNTTNDNPAVIATENSTDVERPEALQKTSLQKEFEKVKKFYAAKNIDGLIGILKTGQPANKIMAANFLANLGDTKAIDALKQASDTIKKDSSVNPYKKAIEKIKKANPDNKETDSSQAPQSTSPAETISQTKSKPQNQRILEFKVIDKETKEPITATLVKTRFGNTKKDYQTDGNGRCFIDVPLQVRNYSVSVDIENYVPMRICNWSNGSGQCPVPEEYTLAIEKGNTIGGYVQDESGIAIANAELEFNFDILKLETNFDKKNIEDYRGSGDLKVKTNEKGFWQFKRTPLIFRGIGIYVRANGYSTQHLWVYPENTEYKDLQQLNCIFILKPGIGISGRIIDEKGLPIQGVTVSAGTNRHMQDEGFKKTTTDAKGYYTLDNLTVNEHNMNNILAGQTPITIQKAGYALDMKIIALETQKGHVNFTMKKGGIIKGQIIDLNDKPVAGVSVSVDSFNKQRAIEWRVNTDAQGRFIFDQASDKEIKFEFYKQNYYSSRDEILTASDEEYILTIYPILNIHGKVIDANTLEPVKNFSVDI